MTINPRIIVLLGRVAARAAGMGNHKEGECVKADRVYFLAMHPAAAVRIKTNMPKIEKEFKMLGRCILRFKAKV